MISVYGIGNCDSCRKALKWLESEGIEHEFHDVRKKPLTTSIIDNWTGQLGWEALINRRSTTWRGLDDTDRAALGSDSVAQTLLLHPTLMKRPLIVCGDRVLVGFDAAALAEAVAAD